MVSDGDVVAGFVDFSRFAEQEEFLCFGQWDFFFPFVSVCSRGIGSTFDGEVAFFVVGTHTYRTFGYGGEVTLCDADVTD